MFGFGGMFGGIAGNVGGLFGGLIGGFFRLLGACVSALLNLIFGGVSAAGAVGGNIGGMLNVNVNVQSVVSFPVMIILWIKMVIVAFLARLVMFLREHKLQLWNLLRTLVYIYFLFSFHAIYEEAVMNGLQAATWYDWGYLVLAYPLFLYSAFVTSILNIFSGEKQFPVWIASVLLILYVYRLTFIQGR